MDVHCGKRIRLAGQSLGDCVIHDSIVDGEGLRTTVFTQGCTRGCAGCHNPQTHAVDGGREYDIEEVARSVTRHEQAGITLSGGEPMLQAEACTALARYVHEELGQSVWCYTGYTYEELRERGTDWQRELLRNVDVLVDGPYIASQRDLSLQFRGSGNQRILRLVDGEVASIDTGVVSDSFDN